MLITTKDQYEEAVELLNKEEDPISFDLETDGKDWRVNRLCGIGTSVTRGSECHAFYMPFRHGEGDNLPVELIKDFWKRVLHPERTQILFHGGYDVKVAALHDGYRLPTDGYFEDAIMAALVMNENEPSFKMEALMKRYVDIHAGDADDALMAYLHDRFGGSLRNAKGNLWRAPASIVEPYACQDVISTRQMRDFYLEQMEEHYPDLEALWREMNDFQLDIAKMELRGVKIERAKLPMLYAQAEDRAEALYQEIQDLCGREINPGSPKQLSSWLGLKSTAKAVLQRLPDDRRAMAILEWRQWSKAVSTYYRPYTEYMDDYGILRCNLHITTPGVLTRGDPEKRNGTVAARLSSSNPNLQQIPRGSDSYRVKELFIARSGYTLVELDYSQAELRVAAHYSKDARLTAILLAGGDMHDEVRDEMKVPRHIAKNMNFSAWYGIGPKTFSRNYYIPLPAARKYLSGYHKMFPGVRRLYNACENQALNRGYIRLFTGRRRRYNCLQAPAYKASNNLIQGSVGEMVRIAIMRTARECPEARQVLMVHDSIWFEIPTPILHPTISKLRGIMQDQPQFSLPMLVDAKGGTGFANAVDFPRGAEGVPQEALDRITDWNTVFKVQEAS